MHAAAWDTLDFALHCGMGVPALLLCAHVVVVVVGGRGVVFILCFVLLGLGNRIIEN